MPLIPHPPEAAREANPSRRRLVPRLASAVRRRVQYAWSVCIDSPRQPLAESAADWLVGRCGDGGLPAVSDEAAGSPGLTAAGAKVLASFGLREPADRWTNWVLSTQLPNGSFPDVRGDRPSLLDTAQVVQALLATGNSDVEVALGRACCYLHSRIGAQGDIVPEGDVGSLDAWAAPALRLTCLPALLQAAEQLNQPAWKQTVARSVAYCRRTLDLTRWNTPSHLFAQQLSAMLDLGLLEETRRAMQLPAAVQRRDGAVPAWPHESWVSSAGLAQFAVLWYRLGERDRADRAVACLHHHQHADGGFVGSWGRGACFHATRQTAATALYALQAAQWQVQTSFAAQQSNVEDTIDPWDGRLQAVRKLLADLPPGARVVDVGCGTGRFLQHFAEWFPHLQFTGIDASTELLKHLPTAVAAVEGNLHRLPCGDSSFDAAFAVESLEHALLPRQAIKELCRIVRPGGHLIVIDKQRSHQPLSEHEPWERWFASDELRDWLMPYCDRVDAAAIPHAHHTRPTGLFLSWSATRRAPADVRRVA